MSVLFSDTLESYAVGADPFGAWLDIGFFHGLINTNTLHRNEGSRVYQMGLGGQILWQDLGASNLVNTTVYWLGCNTPDMAIANCVTTATGSLGQVLAYFHVESDRTVSLYVSSTATGGLFQGAALIANSQSQVQHPDTWQDYQVTFGLSTVQFIQGTTTHTYVAVAGTAWVEGTQVCSGTGTTTLSATALPSGGLTINNWEFSGNGFVDNLWSVDSALSTATFPFADLTHARVTQGAIETVGRGKPAARVTQGAIDVVKVPPRAARVTQAVIEVVRRSQNGWIVYEA